MGAFLHDQQDTFEQVTYHRTDDQILKWTLLEARRYANKHKFSCIDSALRMRCIAKQVFSPLDCPQFGGPIDDETWVHPGCTPFPVRMVDQIDLFMNKAIDYHAKVVLRRIEQLVGKISKTAPGKIWFEVFLTVYLLLSTIEEAWINQIN